MSAFPVKLPDVGEGVAEAELISWCVAVGDHVTTESVLAEVMTDKATVEVACPVDGVVTELNGSPGDMLAVGSALVVVEVEGVAPAAAPERSTEPVGPDGLVASEPSESVGPVELAASSEDSTSSLPPPTPRAPSGRSAALAAPAVRARARSLGVDLASLHGSGPDGRVLHEDLDRHLLGGSRPSPRPATAGGPTVEPVRGLRRRISDRLTEAWSQIPHITYVDSVDATDLEALRTKLNTRHGRERARLTMLPFLVHAITVACSEQQRLNAHYDKATESLSVFDEVHVGVATQTPDGLMVPVVRNAGARSLWDLSAEITRVSTAAREGSAKRDELTGSTITITSLGALGGIVTTPIINAPEVAIIGVNKLETKPLWRNGSFQPRQVFNLSSSFDHRIVDGWDAATFVQRIKELLEMPALLFLDTET